MAGSEKTRPAPMVFGGSLNRVTSSVHRGRRMHSPPLGFIQVGVSCAKLIVF